VDDVQELCGRKTSCWDEKIASARSLRDRFPKELLAHRVLVSHALMVPRDFPTSDALRSDLRKQYADLSRRYPRNPAFPYLLARLERNRKKNRELLERSVALDPGFPWAREALVRALSRKPTEEERRLSHEHLEAFARACPARTGVLLSLLSGLEDRAAWEAHAPALRAATRPDGDRPEELKTLWELEFKFAEPTRFAFLRENVKVQLEALRREDRAADRRWLSALEEGYKLTGDDAGKSWVEETTLAKFPCEWSSTRIWLGRFEKEHGKFPEVEGDAQQKWLADQLAAMKPRLAQCPHEGFLWQLQLQALGMRDGVSPKSLLETGERVRAILGDAGGGPVADVWLDKGIALDRVAALIEAADRQADRDRKLVQAAGLDEEDLRQESFYQLYAKTYNRALRVRLGLARRDAAATTAALAGLESSMKELENVARTSGEKSMIAGRQAQLWKLRAEADVLAGREEDALAKYARAIEKNPDDKKILKAAEELYSRRHGAEDFDAWFKSAQRAANAASPEVTRAVRRPLPDFGLTDVAGKRWTAAELRGKAVFLNFWATWCGPCRRELPHVQKLHERSKDRKDVAVVTVSVDENPGLIEPMLKEEKYTFPVLVAGAGSFTKWAPSGIPQSYVVDPTGTIVEEQLGFGGDGDSWVTKMEERLRKAAAGSPGSLVAR